LLRPIGLTTSSAKCMTPMGTSHSFYSKFWKDMPTLTPVRSHRRPSTHEWYVACSTVGKEMPISRIVIAVPNATVVLLD
jgi:hypothetical protein